MRLTRSGRHDRSSPLVGALWLWPAVSVAASVAATVVLMSLPTPDGIWRTVLWPGDTQALVTLTQIVAASAITVTTLTFSLTVVALQLASQQFSPRLLREFTKDRVTKAVLAVLLSTFACALVLLRGLDTKQPPPVHAAAVLLVLAFVSVCALLGFITHIVRILRVDTMMRTVHEETGRSIEKFYPPYEHPGPRDRVTTPEGDGALVLAERGGFVRFVGVEALIEAAERHRAFVQLLVRGGDHIVRGTPIARTWHEDGGAPEDAVQLGDAVRDALVTGYERTLEQDAAFGFRQLEDIAVGALSPGINDPVTAAHAIGHMSDLLVKLAGAQLGPTVHPDGQGTGRAVVPDRDLPYYLEIACGQVRRYAAREPSVLNALLGMLRDTAASVRDRAQADAIAMQADLIVRAADSSMLEEERASIEDMRARVQAALDRDLLGAYLDRTGETRSI